MKGYVYILESLKDEKQYIGSTTDVKRRLSQHFSGQVRSTLYRRPLRLKYVLEYNDIKKARIMEKKFKKSHDLLLKELRKRKMIGV
ncbi:MAG: hypothetical protein KatS3mg092_0431 [Patescibacteria group bacterium]|nr:MAG: hypothetical protein KatS3mg092_0431 [Patescibacteria group bacterium]